MGINPKNKFYQVQCFMLKTIYPVQTFQNYPEGINGNKGELL